MAKSARTPARAPRKPSQSEQAARHSRTRAAHAVETAEDYAEIISDLTLAKGGARVTDLAACLGVSHVTVVRTVARLAREGLVVSRPYRALSLTAAGERMAAAARHRHEVVLSFLRALGVPEATAQEDAEGIEHHVSKATLESMERFVRSRR